MTTLSKKFDGATQKNFKNIKTKQLTVLRKRSISEQPNNFVIGIIKNIEEQ